MSNWDNNNSGYGYPPQQQGDCYGQQNQYGQQSGGYGPPANGGFQHAQQPPMSYDNRGPSDYNQYPGQQQPPHHHQHHHQHNPNQPPQQPPYDQYGSTAPSYNTYDNQSAYPSQPPSHQFPQQGAYNQNPYPGDPNNPYTTPSMQGQGPDGAEAGERGLMGALAGGAAGAYGGHKMGHGFIGTIAGAFLGSKLEDEAKERRKHGHGQHGQGGYQGGGQGW